MINLCIVNEMTWLKMWKIFIFVARQSERYKGQSAIYIDLVFVNCEHFENDSILFEESNIHNEMKYPKTT